LSHGQLNIQQNAIENTIEDIPWARDFTAIDHSHATYIVPPLHKIQSYTSHRWTGDVPGPGQGPRRDGSDADHVRAGKILDRQACHQPDVAGRIYARLSKFLCNASANCHPWSNDTSKSHSGGGPKPQASKTKGNECCRGGLAKAQEEQSSYYRRYLGRN
jgi:hypothetical protein